MARRGFGKWAALSAHPAAGAVRLPMGHARALPARPPLASGGLRRADARLLERRKAAAGLTALTFTGGCLAAVIFLAPWLWRGRVLLALAGGAALLSLAVFLEGSLVAKVRLAARDLPAVHRSPNHFLDHRGSVGAGPGRGGRLAAARRAAWLLALWVVGTFCVHGVSQLDHQRAFDFAHGPRRGDFARPPFAIRERKPKKRIAAFWLHGRRIAWAAAAILALLVAQSDFVLAAAVRQSALQTGRALPAGRAASLWFQGHWGFQYYMAEQGGMAQDNESAPTAPRRYCWPCRSTTPTCARPMSLERNCILPARGF